MNSKNLAMRDAALAALLGAGPADFGVDFGDDDYGDIGVDFGADAVQATPAPSTAQLHQMWQKMARSKARASQRELLLEPNKDSHVKIERYSFSVSTTVTLSTAAALTGLSGSPATNIRPQRVSMNAPAPGFATIDDIKVANVSVLVGGEEDAYGFNANGVGQQLDMPTLTPANKLSVSGSYSGLLPSGGYVTATPFKFIASFRGPASIVA
jgi:hypothetical protein